MKTYLFELKDKSLVSVRSMNAKSAYNKIKTHVSIDEIVSCYHVYISDAGIVRFGLNQVNHLE